MASIDFENNSTDMTVKEESSSSTQITPKSNASSVFTPTSSNLADKLLSHSTENKQRNKLGLKLRIPEEKNTKKEIVIEEPIAQPSSNVVFEESECNVEKPALSPGQFGPQVISPQIENSPFGLFDPRLSGNIPSGESLCTRLQGYSYGFQEGGNLSMNLQSSNILEERLDSAKVNAFFNQGQNDQQCFNFEEDRNCQEDIYKIAGLMAAELPHVRGAVSNDGNTFFETNFRNYSDIEERNPYYRGDFLEAPRKLLKSE